ncbi:hypothetical protein GDO81_006966 [Engystomops pustulosus]|uniref:Uncharacterized protein n=1 Tax=Engystomops pustulosus TaxID=76066 RepID=A0AAV7D463_ENGPU|nr:hypothetical protein GDO81_006966 [Engystomops pustulosus]
MCGLTGPCPSTMPFYGGRMLAVAFRTAYFHHKLSRERGLSLRANGRKKWLHCNLFFICFKVLKGLTIREYVPTYCPRQQV